MKPSRALLGVNALSFIVLVLLYGGDVVDYVRARSAPVAAFDELPRLWFAVPVLLAAIGIAVAVVWAARQGRDASWRGYRLMAILFLVSTFVDLFALSEGDLPLSSADQLGVTLQITQRLLEDVAENRGLPTDAAELNELVKGLGQPPYLVNGEPVPNYAIQVRTGCESPVVEAPGAQVGTLLYCITPDRRGAFLTAVALPAEERFGSPTLFTKDGNAVYFTVATTPEGTDEAGLADLDAPFGREPAALTGPDAGQ